MHARHFLEPDETGLVIFTHGPNFIRYDEARGTSGEWQVNPNRTVDRVIIYVRDEPAATNKIYLATYDKTRPSSQVGRYFIDLLHIQYAGTTEVNWYEFAGEGQNPFRYVQAESKL